MLVMTASSPKPPAKTTAQRQTEFKARMRASGLQQVTLWAHPDDHPAIKAYAAKLTAKRTKGAP